MLIIQNTFLIKNAMFVSYMHQIIQELANFGILARYILNMFYTAVTIHRLYVSLIDWTVTKVLDNVI